MLCSPRRSASSPSCPKSPAARRASTSPPPLNQVLEAAFKEAEKFKDEYVSTEHLLLALSDQKYEPAGSLLNKQGAIS